MGDFIAFLLVVGLYFLPTMIGHKKRKVGGIFALNLLTGWTFIGWIGALIWACTKDAVPPPVVVQQAARPAPLPPPAPPRPATPTMTSRTLPVARPNDRTTGARPPAQPTEVLPSPPERSSPPPVATGVGLSLANELERLFQLKENGALTDEEYSVQKTKLLA